ncbi:DEAD/DEAH box helicase, partial [Planktomarina temperata]|nr:DEAD/DEAH box helicase [Planktomarina temperata]
PKHMNELAATYLKNPERVAVSRPGEVADKITQEVHFVAGAAKTDFLIEKLAEHRSDAAIVFARTKHGSERLMKTLSKAGYATDSVHGNKSQGQRQRAIDALRGGTIKVLVATDVAARGLDIPDVRFVYNYDLPNVPENYVHRIGRTARAGRDGRAIAFVAPDEMGELKDVEKVLKMEIPIASGRRWDLVPGVDTRKPKRKQPSGRGGGGGGAGGGRRNNDNWGKEQPRGGRGGAPKAHTARAEAKPALEGRWDPTNDGPALEAPKPKGRKSKGQASDQAQGPVGNGGRPQRGPSGAKFAGKPKGRGGKPKGKPNMGGNAKPRRPQA